MSKKNQAKDKKKPFGQPKLLQFNNLSAERLLNVQLGKAHALLEADENLPALAILETLNLKFPANPKVLDLLGVCYSAIGRLEKACQTYEHLAQITNPNKLVVVYYNLARTYPELGFPVLAYLALQKVTAAKLADALGRFSVISEYNQLKTACEEQVRLNAKENYLSFEAYLEIAEPFERGRWAMQTGDYIKAKDYLNEVLKLEPSNIPARNNLTLVYFLLHDFEQALNECRYVLDKLEPDNIHAPANLTRLYLAEGQLNQGRAVLPKLRELAKQANPGHIIKIAESHAFYEDDQTVYNLLSPLLTDLTKLELLERPILLQAVVLGVVASANLGRYHQALQIIERLRPPEPDLLLLRTVTALENNESGPRANERFFYFDPQLLNPVLFEQFTKLVTNLSTDPKTQSEMELFAKLQPFITQSGDFVLEVMTYRLWLA
jgi:tetratricopeptide (TPR) repeat protein